jgi:hypothetical protein
MDAYKGVRRWRFHAFLYSWLADGGDISLTRRPPFTPRKIPGAYFCYKLSQHQGP